MKRRLTVREWFLLGLLAAVALASGYVMLFYTPMTSARDRALEQTELARLELETVQLRLEEKRRMERELEEIFAQEELPVSLARYDNVQSVMVELHSILSAAEDYSLTFSTVDTQETIVRRSISLSFTASSYEAAKEVLRQLHGSLYRCMVDGLSISLDRDMTGPVSVSAALVYFEYQA